MVRKIVWDKEAILQMEAVYIYLKEQHELQAANKVRKAIKETVQGLPKHPEIYPLDRFKKHNNNEYRAFEKYSYRVSYRIKEDEIRILRIRHTSRLPLE